MNVRDDEGVTLIELLIVVAMTGLLATAVAAAFVVGFRTTDEANVRLAGSQGAQLVTSYFPSDVRSATAGPTVASTCAAGASGAHFTWRDIADTAVQYKSAEYCLMGTTLLREFREGSVTANTLQGVAGILATEVSAATVTCDPSPCGTPTTVTMSVTNAGFPFSVTGRRRTP